MSRKMTNGLLPDGSNFSGWLEPESPALVDFFCDYTYKHFGHSRHNRTHTMHGLKCAERKDRSRYLTYFNHQIDVFSNTARFNPSRTNLV